MPADEKLFEGGETVDACICGFKKMQTKVEVFRIL